MNVDISFQNTGGVRSGLDEGDIEHGNTQSLSAAETIISYLVNVNSQVNYLVLGLSPEISIISTLSE